MSTLTLNLHEEELRLLRRTARRRDTTVDRIIAELIGSLVLDDAPIGVNLRERGIERNEAVTLRARMASFAEDWNSPEMDVYDDYDAARSRI